MNTKIFYDSKEKRSGLFRSCILRYIYDSNAVAVSVGVISKDAVKVGYLPAPLAKIVSTLNDKGMALKAVYKEIRGKYEKYMNYGIEINISL